MKIGEVIRCWRRIQDVGLREGAREIGVSHGTLSRVERGEKMDAETLLKIFRWLFDDQAEKRK